MQLSLDLIEFIITKLYQEDLEEESERLGKERFKQLWEIYVQNEESKEMFFNWLCKEDYNQEQNNFSMFST